MQKTDLSNQLWAIANNQEAEFEYFCKAFDLDINHPETLRMYKNQILKTVEVQNAREF